MEKEMALQICPKCKKLDFTWFIDDEESPLTQWGCGECAYHAFEDESKLRDCTVCGDKDSDSYMIEDENKYWWCSSCGRIEPIVKKFNYSEYIKEWTAKKHIETDNIEIKNILDNGFYEFMEYEICKYFENNNNQNTKGFWCDGILFDWIDEDNQIIYCKTFIGKKGETKYTLALLFGNKIISENKNGIDIKTYFIMDNWENNFHIDLENKKIIIEIE
jgi:hypothetical protein